MTSILYFLFLNQLDDLLLSFHGRVYLAKDAIKLTGFFSPCIHANSEWLAIKNEWIRTIFIAVICLNVCLEPIYEEPVLS